MRLVLFLLLSLYSFDSFAQKEYVMDIAAGPVLNYEVFRTIDFKKPSAPSVSLGAQILFKIKGEDEGHSELNIIPGFLRQNFHYRDNIGQFNIFSNSLSLQSEVVLRKPNRNLNPTLGIGVMRTAFNGMRWNVAGKKTDFKKVPDSLMTQIRTMDRRFHPFVGLGLSWTVRAGIRQLDICAKALIPLKDYMSQPSIIKPWFNYGLPNTQMDINALPVYANISVVYYYSRLKNWSFKKL